MTVQIHNPTPQSLASRVWQRLLRHFAVDALNRSAGEAAGRLVRKVAFAGIVVEVGFAWLHLEIGLTRFAWLDAVAILALAGVAAIAVRMTSLALYAAASICLLHVGVLLWQLGRIDNGAAIWVLVPALAATIIGLRRMALYCAGLGLATLVLVDASARLGGLTPQVTIPDPNLFMGGSITMLLGLSAYVAWIVQRARQALVEKVRAKNVALAAALEEARVARLQAEQASHAKEQFLANLTHEIRTPLSGIAGTIELLQHARLGPDHHPLVGALATSANNLVELVNAMLDHAKLRAGHASVESAALSIRQLAQHLADLYAARAADKGLRLKVHIADGCPEAVLCDGIKLRQIIGNLVANAIKFTEAGTVDVRIHASSAGPGAYPWQLVVDVSDSGPGIPVHQLPSIFEPFVQGDASIARRHGGTGLGLAIGRQLAQLMGGTLDCVHNEAGMGCVFRLSVPVEVTHHVDEPPTGSAQRPDAPQRPRVLLAEDNPINRLVAVAMLAKLDAIVQSANDGQQAVQWACEGDFDLVLMDLQMPGLDGIAAARAIRAHEAARVRDRVPIVALTGNSAEDYGQRCVDAGMDGFVVKPISIEGLREVLARYTRRRDRS